MPDISLTRNTQLRGGDLQNAVSSMIQDLAGQSPYRMAGLSQSWASPTQINLSAPGYVSGTVTLRDGNPSTVTVAMDLSGAAENMRDRVIRDMNAQADRYLAGTAASQPSTTTAPPAEESWLERRRRERREREAAEAASGETRREFDWNLFGSIFSDITTGVATSLSAVSEAYAQTTAEQAVAVASETEAAASGKQVFNGAVLYPGQEVPPSKAPAPTLQRRLATPVMTQPGGMPTWGWWALGLGGAAAVGVTVWLVRRS